MLLDGALVKQVVEYFSDVVVDTHAVRERESKLPEVYRHAESSEVTDVIRALYQRLWGENLGVEDRGEVDRLARIPYLDASQWGDSLRSFAQVIAPLIQQETDDGNGQGGMMGDTQQYSAGELAAGMEQFAEQGFYAFREMVRDFADELQDANMMPDMGRGKGTPSDADLLFYMARASAFRLPVQTMPLEKVGWPTSAFSFALGNWETRPAHRCVDEFWARHAGHFPDVELARWRNPRRWRWHTRLCGHCRFLGQYGRSVSRNIPRRLRCRMRGRCVFATGQARGRLQF